MIHEEVQEILKRSDEALKILQESPSEDVRQASIVVEALKGLAQDTYCKFHEIRKLQVQYELKRLRKMFVQIKKTIDGESSQPIDKIVHDCIVDMTCKQAADSNDN